MNFFAGPCRLAALGLLLLTLCSATLAQTVSKLTATQGKRAPVSQTAMSQAYGWAPAPSLSIARTALATAVLNNKLYALGGLPSDSSTVEVFDQTTNSWSTAPSMPTPRLALAAVVLNNKLYALGGFSSGGTVNTVDVFDPVANLWSTGTPMLSARDSFSAVALDNKIYAMGGYNGNTFLQTVEVFDPTTNLWSAAPALPMSHSAGAATVLDNKIYILGGGNGSSSFSNTVDVYDPVANSWSPAPAMSTGRQNLAAVTLKGKLYAIGGYSINGGDIYGYLKVVEVYDPITQSWTAAPPLLSARATPAAGVLGDKIYAVGGQNHDGYLRTVDVFTPVAQFGDVLISEFRLDGPGGAQDEFIELYNNTDAPITVASADGSAGWGLFSSDSVLRATLLNGDVIPARGHYLLANSIGYSLSGYPANTAGAVGNRGYTTDIPTNTGIALVTTASPQNFAAGNILDTVGSAAEAHTLFKEGVGYPTINANSGLNYSFVRRLDSGVPQDTGDNAADFIYIAADNTTDIGAGSRLGAPGPENSNSPIQRNAQFKAALIDAGAPSTSAPNRVRDTTANVCGGPNCALGTFTIRRKFTNKTGGFVTRLRFRIVDITTAPAPVGTADLRVLDAIDQSVATSGGNVTVKGTTREQPPPQLLGGGLNTTLTVALGGALAPNASVNVQFVLGVQQGGGFRFLVNVEALP